MDWLEIELLGNPLRAWGLATLLLLLVVVGLRLVGGFAVGRVRRLADRTDTDLDDLAADLLERLSRPVLLVLGLWAATLALRLPPALEEVFGRVAVLAVLLQAGIWGNTFIAFLVGRFRRTGEGADASAATTVSALAFVGKLLLWSLLLLVALDNLGYDVTALIAGLGIGGVAVALAVQNILGDLFASLSIVLDRPFVIGDFLIIGNEMGTVEHVGLKSTRVRSLSGEQLIFSNRDLLESRIRNYGRMEERRIVFELGVTYRTPPGVMERIPGMVREILEKQEPVRVDRCHFKGFGESALQVEAVYYVEDPSYEVYMDIQEAVNLELMRRFEREGIEFAYPTRTVVLESGSRPDAGEASPRDDGKAREGGGSEGGASPGASRPGSGV